MEMTEALAHETALAAGDRNMTACGRSEWNREDMDRALLVYQKLWPQPVVEESPENGQEGKSDV